MAEFIYTMKDLRKVVPPQREILKGIWLSFFYGAKIGVLGLNGAGKSSLLRIMAGVDQDYLGEATPAKGTKVGFLPQEPQLDADKTVVAGGRRGGHRNARPARPLQRGRREIRGAHGRRRHAEAARRAGPAAGRDRRRQRCGSWTGSSRSPWTPCAAAARDAPVSALSGGERRRVALCRLLLAKPDLLLLDEPTNHLDAESVAWLERFLQEYTGTVVAVTHDRYFLDNVAGWILELDRGAGIPWEGNYSSWLEQKQRAAGGRGKAGDRPPTHPAARAGVDAHVPAGRQAKSKARLQAYEKMLAEAPRKSRARSRSTSRRARAWATW